MHPVIKLAKVALAAVLIAGTRAYAENHTIQFNNECGIGTPMLVLGNEVLSTGDAYTVEGRLTSAIAFLQTGVCGSQGENCTLLEMTLWNPIVEGLGSGTDISLIPPHAFNVEVSFRYFNGCDGVGRDCNNPECPEAYHTPEDGDIATVCQANNVGLLITFCGNDS